MSEIIRLKDLQTYLVQEREKRISEHLSFTLDELSKFKAQTALNKKLGKTNTPLFPSSRSVLAGVLNSEDSIKEDKGAAEDGFYDRPNLESLHCADE